jgi:hypothetical protein
MAAAVLGLDILETEGEGVPAYAHALDADIQGAMAEPDGANTDSLLRVTEGLAACVSKALLEGRFDELDEHSTLLYRLLGRFPLLTRLRDLEPLARAGCRLDALFIDLVAICRTPSERRLRQTLAAPQGSLLHATLEVLSEADEWWSTNRIRHALTDRRHATSRQHLHQVLASLRAHGLATHDTAGQQHAHRLSAAGRRFWAEVEAQTVAASSDDRRAVLPFRPRRAADPEDELKLKELASVVMGGR